MSAMIRTLRRGRTLAVALLAMAALAAPRVVRADEPENTPPHATLGTVHVDGPTEMEATAHAKPGEKTEAKGEEEESEEPKPINWVDFSNKKQPPLAAYVINLVLLGFLLNYLLRDAIVGGLKDRRDRVAKDIEEAQKMKKEAEKRAKKYQAQLDRLDDDQASTKKALLEAGEADKKRIVREAEEKAARMERDAALLLEQEARQQRHELTRETVEIALAAAEELLKKGMTMADQERLAEEFLAQLDSRGRGPSSPGGSSGGGGGGGGGSRPAPEATPRSASIPPMAQTGGDS